MKTKLILLSVALLTLWSVSAAADQQILDDLIVDGSACVGLDCVNGETFDFNTVVLKENNTRLHFWDTSTSAAFPTNDWTLEANASSNGGGEYFAIVDATWGRRPFAVYAGAPNAALTVTDVGVGLGVDPLTALHLTGEDTPTIRIEQNGFGGWAPYVWDIGANESSFFVRDSMSNTLPFHIMPGAPSNSLAISSNGLLGIGTASPVGVVHLVSDLDYPATDVTAGQWMVENTATGEHVMLHVSNAGVVHTLFDDATANSTWRQTFGGDPLGGGEHVWTLTETQTGVEAARINDAGMMAIAGTLTQGSSRAIKHGFSEVRSADVLRKVAGLEISRWRYKADRTGSEHIGPMAEEFHRAFGLGADDRHIAPADMAAVAVSSTQALNDLVTQQAQQIAELERTNAALEERLARIEAALLDR